MLSVSSSKNKYLKDDTSLRKDQLESISLPPIVSAAEYRNLTTLAHEASDRYHYSNQPKLKQHQSLDVLLDLDYTSGRKLRSPESIPEVTVKELREPEYTESNISRRRHDQVHMEKF